jgi:hypothetical protein
MKFANTRKSEAAQIAPRGIFPTARFKKAKMAIMAPPARVTEFRNITRLRSPTMKSRSIPELRTFKMPFFAIEAMLFICSSFAIL